LKLPNQESFHYYNINVSINHARKDAELIPNKEGYNVLQQLFKKLMQKPIYEIDFPDQEMGEPLP
jgi:hypothetical protein